MVSSRCRLEAVVSWSTMDTQERLAILDFVRQLLLAVAILLGLWLIFPPVGILSTVLWVLYVNAQVKRAIARLRAMDDE